MVNIRAKRRKPGLLPQHLSATRAAASITGAKLQGDQLGSGEITFAPSHLPRPGSYLFDVAEIAGRGSAGSATLILQTILLPLALMQGRSELVVRGGTHLEWAPAYDDFANVYLPALRLLGFEFEHRINGLGLVSGGWRRGTVHRSRRCRSCIHSQRLAEADQCACSRPSQTNYGTGRRCQSSQ